MAERLKGKVADVAGDGSPSVHCDVAKGKDVSNVLAAAVDTVGRLDLLSPVTMTLAVRSAEAR